jgi:predicted secreted protein
LTKDGGGDTDRDVKRMSVVAGGTFQIHLWEDRTRGELWVSSYDPACLMLVGGDYARTANGNAVDSGRRTFEFQAVTPGAHRLVFEKRLGWKFTAEDRRVFQIDVTEPPVEPRELHA